MSGKLFQFMWQGKQVGVWTSEKMDGEGDGWCWSCDQCEWIKDAQTKCKVDGAELDYYDGPLRTEQCFRAEEAWRAAPTNSEVQGDAGSSPVGGGRG